MRNLNDNFSVLVMDGEHRAALAVTRSLGNKGVNIIVGSELENSLAGSSRYIKKRVVYPSPFEYQIEFIKELQNIIKRHNINMVIPITDMSMYSVLKHAPMFEPAIIPFVPFEKYIEASNKINLVKLAMKVGVPVPETTFIMKPEKIESYSTGIVYPAILKPLASLIEYHGKIVRTSVVKVQSKDEMFNIVKTNPAFSSPFMIQECVSGEGMGVFLLLHKEQLLAFFAHRRIREKPPWGGVSVVCESIQPDQNIKDNAITLLRELQWEGPAMVEFKMDEKRGVPVIMEINARFWGSLQLAIDSGVDFPNILYSLYRGKEMVSVLNYKKSRLRWLLGDLDNLYLSIKNNNDKLPNTYNNKSKVLKNFIKEFFLNSKNETFRFSDPRPFFFEVKEYLKDLLPNVK